MTQSEKGGTSAELADIAKEMCNLADEPIVTGPEGRALLRKGAAEIIRLRTAIRSSQQAMPEREAIAWAERDQIIEECAKIADGWLKAFGNREILYVSARDYASDAVQDIAENIRALATPAQQPQGGEG